MNWQELIDDIQSYGWSQAQIAAECNCGQVTISDLARGKAKEPPHSRGEKLKALLARLQDDISEVRGPLVKRDRRNKRRACGHDANAELVGV